MIVFESDSAGIALCGRRNRSVSFSIVRASFDHAVGVNRRSSSRAKGAHWFGSDKGAYLCLPRSDMGAGRKSSSRAKGAHWFGSDKGAYLLPPDIRGNIGADRSSSSRVKGAHWFGSVIDAYLWSPPRGGGPSRKRWRSHSSTVINSTLSSSTTFQVLSSPFPTGVLLDDFVGATCSDLHHSHIAGPLLSSCPKLSFWFDQDSSRRCRS